MAFITMVASIITQVLYNEYTLFTIETWNVPQTLVMKIMASQLKNSLKGMQRKVQNVHHTLVSL